MRRTSILAWVLMAASYAACGGTPSKPHPPDPDAGSGTTGSVDAGPCQDDFDCRSGEHCIQGRCGSCRGTPILACPGDETCAQNGACIPRGGSSGSTGGSSGSSGATGVPCAHRSDCPGSQACLPGADGGACGVPPDGQSCTSNDGCLKAFVCQAQTCVLGCYSNLDCHGTQQPVCAAGNPGHCAACTSSSQCFTGESCSSGHCVPQQACQGASTCAGLGCVNGYCGPCTANLDCDQGQYCERSSGHCRDLATSCTSDVQCQDENEGPGWYCGFSNGSKQCQLGCTPDSFCAVPQLGCCNLAAGASCSPTTHTCVQSSASSSSAGSTGGSSGGDSGSSGSGSASGSSTGSGSGSGSGSGTGTSSSSTGATGGSGSSGTTGLGSALQSGVADGPFSGAFGSDTYFYIDVPSGASFLAIELTQDSTSTEADLYTRFGTPPDLSNFDCVQYGFSDRVYCNVAAPQPGRYYVMVDGSSDYSGVSLTATVFTAPAITGNTLQAAAPDGPLAANTGSSQRFTLSVPAGASMLGVFLGPATGANGDADLYVRFNANATTTTFDCMSDLVGDSEGCEIPAPQAGSYHITVYGYQAFTAAYVLASYR